MWDVSPSPVVVVAVVVYCRFRSDGAAALFDEWYRVAVLHAKGQLIGGPAALMACTTELVQHLLHYSRPAFFTTHSSDEEVCA